MPLASGGFQEKTGRFECLWSPFAALDYAVGSCGRILMRVQMSESNTKNSISLIAVRYKGSNSGKK